MGLPISVQHVFGQSRCDHTASPSPLPYLFYVSSWTVTWHFFWWFPHGFASDPCLDPKRGSDASSRARSEIPKIANGQKHPCLPTNQNQRLSQQATAKFAPHMGDPHGDPQTSPQHADPHGFLVWFLLTKAPSPRGPACRGLARGPPCGSPMWGANFAIAC